ncbi:MAG TPA: hotdog fold domain-containing protein [Lysobacter sp.]|nr:hotdog fold domain-containing protein [Lysobacter sp.]
MTEPAVLRLYRKLGSWLFARAICFKAPYFATIAPRFRALEPGRCVATLRHRRRVSNHLGTVHAIALCNLAELTAGLVTEASLPTSMRWIPKGMNVEYLKKAVGSMCAEATPEQPAVAADAGYELPVRVVVTDSAGDTVMRARIAMWVSPRR